MDTELLSRTRRWRTIALILLVGAAVRSWLFASSPGALFVAVVWTVVAAGMVLAALAEVPRERAVPLPQFVRPHVDTPTNWSFLRIPARRPHLSWGSLLPAVGYARCYRCRRPWWAARETHEAQYAPGRSQFALCAWCWQRSAPWWRFHAHRWLVSWAWTERSAEETEALLCAVHEAAWADDDAAWHAARQVQR